MSDANVERTRRVFDAFNAGDIDAELAYAHPNTEFQTTFLGLGGVYRGHDGLRRWHRDLKESWGDEIRAEVEAFFDLGEQALVFFVLRGRGRQSGVEVAMSVATVYTWRDGLLVYTKAYVHREDALRELGVSLDELEPIAP